MTDYLKSRALGALIILLGVSGGSGSALADSPCAAVQTFVYKLKPGQEKSFHCHSHTKVFDVAVPARGLALAQIQFVMANSAGHATHFWSLGVKVGQPIFKGRMGDDIASGGNTGVKQVLGYGELTDAHHNAMVSGRQGSTVCSENAVSMWSGATLKVFVAVDQRPACRGKDIVAISYATKMTEKGFIRPYLPNFVWPVHGAQDLELEIETTPERPNLLVMSAVEGTVNKTISKLTAGITVDDYRIHHSKWVPHSDGMGHLVLNANFSTLAAPPKGEAPYSLSPGVHTVTHFVGNVSTNVHAATLPNCCGDSVLAAVRMR